MFSSLPTYYAQWRLGSGVAAILREDHESPPERLLQAIWQHQRLLRDQLRSLDGLPVRILHPGFQSLEGGPDFRQAVIQMGDEAPRAGDVEVDIRASGWRGHGHDRNPAFKGVILHVVWDGERPALGGPPVLVLRPALDAPIGQLSLWLGSETGRPFPDEFRGKCAEPLSRLPPERLSDLLRQAAHVRFQAKASQFHARARQAGWVQALWEGLFRALGYKNNVWPMQRLAELRSRWLAPGVEPFVLQARLLGISGLLPVELSRSQPGPDQYVRRVWDQWWRERDAFSDCILPKMVWHFHGLRPANHPQRRLALAADWSVRSDLVGRLEAWCSRAIADHLLPDSLLEVLRDDGDDFWSFHWTLKSSVLKKPQPLLGAVRATDLAVNVVLPWLWVRAVEGKNQAVQQAIERRYFAWPSAQDNSLLRLARQRLLKGAGPKVLPNAAAQQGLIQLVRDFCDHSNAICDHCQFPGLASNL